MGKQKSAAAAGAVATGPVPRPPVLEHTTAELVSLIANLSEREDFTVDMLVRSVAPHCGPLKGPSGAGRSSGSEYRAVAGRVCCSRSKSKHSTHTPARLQLLLVVIQSPLHGKGRAHYLARIEKECEMS